MPAPMASPMPAVSQMPAAVVRPLTVPPFLMMTAEHRKLMPLTTWAATRAESAPRVPGKSEPSGFVRSTKPYLEMIMMSAAAKHTTMCVRTPASLKRRLRSAPMAAPQAQATSRRTQKSRFCASENWVLR